MERPSWSRDVVVASLIAGLAGACADPGEAPTGTWGSSFDDAGLRVLRPCGDRPTYATQATHDGHGGITPTYLRTTVWDAPERVATPGLDGDALVVVERDADGLVTDARWGDSVAGTTVHDAARLDGGEVVASIEATADSRTWIEYDLDDAGRTIGARVMSEDGTTFDAWLRWTRDDHGTWTEWVSGHGGPDALAAFDADHDLDAPEVDAVGVQEPTYDDADHVVRADETWTGPPPDGRPARRRIDTAFDAQGRRVGVQVRVSLDGQAPKDDQVHLVGAFSWNDDGTAAASTFGAYAPVTWDDSLPLGAIVDTYGTTDGFPSLVLERRTFDHGLLTGWTRHRHAWGPGDDTPEPDDLDPGGDRTLLADGLDALAALDTLELRRQEDVARDASGVPYADTTGLYDVDGTLTELHVVETTWSCDAADVPYELDGLTLPPLFEVPW